MRVALEVWSADHRRVLEACRAAEDLGLDAFYYGESPTGLNLDCWTTLASLAAATDRIRLGPVIANVLDDYRSLALLARQAATVAAISEGRLDFRTGAGAARRFGRRWWEPFGVAYPDYDARLAAVEHALAVLPALWRGEAVALGGGAAPVALGIECPPIPITMAATGARAIAVAAEHADVWEVSFLTATELAARVRDRPESGRRRTRISLEIDGFVGTTPERAAAVEAGVRADRGSDEDLEPILARALRGPPSAVVDQLSALAEAGADDVVVALHDPLSIDAIMALAEARNRGPHQ